MARDGPGLFTLPRRQVRDAPHPPFEGGQTGSIFRELGGALLTVRPDRARCTVCRVTNVVLDAGLLPRRAYTAAVAGQAWWPRPGGAGTGSSRTSWPSRTARCRRGPAPRPRSRLIRPNFPSAS
jgi:hypothetical protein